MLTEKDYCDYDTCVALEELGYPRYHYDNGGELDKILRMVTLYNAQKWLREEKQIEIVVHSFDYVGEPYFADIHMYREVRCACSYADSYEEALSEGVRVAVKILKEK
jgi:hypothetical protein